MKSYIFKDNIFKFLQLLTNIQLQANWVMIVGSNKVYVVPLPSVTTPPGCQAPPPKGPWWLSIRFLITILLGFGLLVVGLMKVGLSMAMVCMVNATALALRNEEPDIFREDPRINVSSEGCVLSKAERSEYEGEFVWDPDEQGYVFSAYFWGSVITSLPAGWLSDRYGPKNLFLLSIVFNIIPSLLTPFAARTNYAFLLSLRLIMGLAQGLILPSIASILARWIPPDERSTVIGIYTAGNQLCMVIGMPLFAWLCSQHRFLGGWPSIFYIGGLVGIPWCVAWMTSVSNSPESNSRLSERERNYILHSLKDENLRSRKVKVPWKEIMLSVPVMACNIGSFAQNFSVNMLQSYLPTYFMEVLYLDIRKNGFFSALPFLSQWIVKLFASYLADVLKRKTSLSRTTICKIFQSIACFGNALFLISLSFLDCTHPNIALLFLCISQGLSSGFIPGVMTCVMYLAPQYSGTVRSMTALWSNVAGLIAPYIVGSIITHGTRREWQMVFFVVATVLVVAGLTFLAFGSGYLGPMEGGDLIDKAVIERIAAEIQPWAKCPDLSTLKDARDEKALPLETISAVVQEKSNNLPALEDTCCANEAKC